MEESCLNGRMKELAGVEKDVLEGIVGRRLGAQSLRNDGLPV